MIFYLYCAKSRGKKIWNERFQHDLGKCVSGVMRFESSFIEFEKYLMGVVSLESICHV